MKKVSVLTPTYNRAPYLKVLYDSLCVQSFKDFEWVIVSDGSKDNTEEVVQGFVSEQKIDIKFIKKENGGKPSAHNAGALAANSELTVICDDDDYMLPDSLKIIVDYWKDDRQIGGMIGYMGETKQKTLKGKKFPKLMGEYNDLEEIFREEIFDTVQIYKTSILRNTLFPIEPDEKFIPDIWCWREINRNYKLIVIPEILEIARYLPNGLTLSKQQTMWNNPIGYSYYFRQKSEFSKGWKKIKYFGVYQGLRWTKRYPVQYDQSLIRVLSIPVSIYVFSRIVFRKQRILNYF